MSTSVNETSTTMKKLIYSLAITAVFAGLGTAGDSKAPVAPKVPLPPLGCACFDGGFEFSAFGSGILFNGYGDDALGGGVALGYFLTENIGIEASYSVHATDPSEEHLITANAVFRLPIKSACIAPYLLAGGGLITNSDTNGLFDLGAGIDIRLEALGCLGIFADATYNWVDDATDFTLIRIGARIPF